MEKFKATERLIYQFVNKFKELAIENNLPIRPTTYDPSYSFIIGNKEAFEIENNRLLSYYLEECLYHLLDTETEEELKILINSTVEYMFDAFYTEDGYLNAESILDKFLREVLVSVLKKIKIELDENDEWIEIIKRNIERNKYNYRNEDVDVMKDALDSKISDIQDMVIDFSEEYVQKYIPDFKWIINLKDESEEKFEEIYERYKFEKFEIIYPNYFTEWSIEN
ncbi:hypothetical protein [Sphingobacterium mizutaii]|uniref:hypothetical protein n=1 Tax=Sphingobacterium mizutaii TaxID=1010 RepID=UPI001624E620|nr:hypothetical protein [Sphingobacterium mizutaii]